MVKVVMGGSGDGSGELPPVPTDRKSGWTGIRPVPAEKKRTADAALELLAAFEAGTAIG